MISRVKIMAGLNIAEKRLPQDGRIRVRVAGRDVDIRVSIIPTFFGERVVLRLLDKNKGILFDWRTSAWAKSVPAGHGADAHPAPAASSW